MSTRLQIAALIYSMIQAVTFGVGALLVLATPLAERAMILMPVVVVASLVVSLPVAWMMAPRLRARFWRDRGIQGDAISG